MVVWQRSCKDRALSTALPGELVPARGAADPQAKRGLALQNGESTRLCALAQRQLCESLVQIWICLNVLLDSQQSIDGCLLQQSA